MIFPTAILKRSFTQLILMSSIVVFSSQAFSAQSKDEVQVGGDEPDLAKNTELNKTVSPEPSSRGCQVVVKNGCPARIACTGQAEILGEDQSDVQDALDAAEAIANQNLAFFRGNKIAAQKALEQAKKSWQKKGPEGTQAVKEIGRLQTASISQGTTDYLQGVVVRATTVDMEKGMATVYIGQSCDSVNAAQESIKNSNLSNEQDKGQSSSQTKPANNSSGTKQGGPKVGTGKPQSYQEKINNDF
jgi:hypothetical protein